MSRMDKLSNYRTTWQTEGERGSVTYVSTKIVEWSGLAVTLNSDGWQTVTTKRKMNQAARQFGLGFSVFQKNHDWFVNCPMTGFGGRKTISYRDGMQIPRN